MPTQSDQAVIPAPWRVPLSDVQLPTPAIEAAVHVLEGGWLSMGPRVEEFELAFAGYVGADHAVACSSGTAALLLALTAVGVEPGDEVVMPSLTFVASANAAALLGARPVFADVRGEDDLTLDPESVERALGPRARAVVIMHYAGHPCAPELVELTHRRGVALVEDAAHAPGARGDPGRCGAWAEAGCFSFFANKNLPLGEGGMLTTSNGDVATAARSLRSHGMSSTTWQRRSVGGARYDVTAPGYNFRLDEPRAALGVALLGLLDDWNAARGRVVRRYREQLQAVDGVSMPFGGRPPTEASAHHLAVVLLPSGADRDRIVLELERRRIETSVHYRPLHHLSAHAQAATRLDRTEGIAARLLTLPLYPHMTDAEVDLVVDELARAVSLAD